MSSGTIMKSGLSPRAARGLSRISIVYEARNILTGDFYIGVTMGNLLKRRREHLHAARSGQKTHFCNAIRKYGADNFVFSELESFETYQEALLREKELIRDRAPRYNITSGGEGVSGFKMPREIVERIAAKKRGTVGYWRGKKRPDIAILTRARLKEHPSRVGDIWRGKKMPEAVKRKISLAKTGRPQENTPAHALEIFADNMKRAAANRRKRIYCLNDGREFVSAADADIFYGLKKPTASQVASGRRNSIFGLKFSYIESSP